VAGGQVYKTPDASLLPGASNWAPLIGTPPNAIPDIPVHVLTFHPDNPQVMFIGTDTGVLGSADAGATWCNVNAASLSNVIVEHLVFQRDAQLGTNKLFAFTHGRGVYTADVDVPVLTVTYPNGGEHLAPNAPTTITWNLDTLTSMATATASFSVELSTDGGTLWSSLATGVPTPTRAFNWDVGDFRSKTALVRVAAMDSTGTTITSDRSDGQFSVNRVPVADAGPDQTVVPGAAVTLDGRASNDPDGDGITYAWVQVGGAPVTLAGQNTAQPSFGTAALGRGEWCRFELTVTDTVPESSVSQVTVQINQLPIAQAGPSRRVTPTAVVMLDGTGSSDAEGSSLTYRWVQVPDTGLGFPQAVPRPTFVAPAVRGTVLDFELDVRDDLEWSAVDTVSVSVNRPPVASASAPQYVRPSTPVTLMGSGSSDGDGDSLAYQWTRTSGPIVTFAPTSPNPTFTAVPTRGVSWSFDLLVSDGLESDGATARVAVNQVPVAVVGPGQVVLPMATVALVGHDSRDPDVGPITYLWTRRTGLFVSFDPTLPDPTFTVPIVRGNSMTFDLQVSDALESSSSQTWVRVNRLPIANPGPDQVVAPSTPVTLNGSGSSDPDVEPITYLWGQTWGPVVNFDPGAVSPVFTAPGTRGTTLTFDLRVTDLIESATRTVRVRVNRAPVAMAGLPQVTAPGATVTLNGSGSHDPDFDPLSYTWTQTAGPQVGIIPSAVNPTFVVPPDRGAVLAFSLTVSDPAESDVKTTAVRINRLPVARVGPDQVARPDSIVTLNGGGSTDPDGDPLAYQWTQLSGPPVTIDPVQARPVFSTGGLPRNAFLTFGLEVSDGLEADAATVTVKINRPPVADAGTDRSATPSTPLVLTGSRSYDPDSDPIAYRWTQLEGTPVQLEATRADPEIVAPAVGRQTLAFKLEVSDSLETTTATVKVALSDRAYPTALGGGGGCAARQERSGTAPDRGVGAPLAFLLLGYGALLARRRSRHRCRG
ncbi:MAG: hypothetical protein HY815_27885, partial [Candidatus Riflebacteria bacterium]|nr:hypothetical protein [Candidatus Riflebacteria bacterium]